MREIHTALIKARVTRKDDGWLTTNELVWLIYPENGTWQDRERQRFAVRKAITALRRDRVEGVWILREGEGSDERVRADLTNWSERYLKTPRHRIRPKRPSVKTLPPEQHTGPNWPCRKCRCRNFYASGFPNECLQCGHLKPDHKR